MHSEFGVVDNRNNFLPLCTDFVCLHPCSIQARRHRVRKNRGLLRIMILLLLLILSSSFIELIQSLIPVPQMVTASLLAAVVAFFVGWEEKITSWFVNGNEEQTEISGDEISDESIRRLTIVLSSWLIFSLVVSWLFASMEVGV